MQREEIASIFERYGSLVLRRALVLLGNRVDAEDAAQEVFIRALKNAEEFRAQARVSTWLYQITTNHCLNVIRDRRRRNELFEEHVASTLATIPGAPDVGDMMLLRRLLQEADEELARAAIYVYVDGMTHDEAADLLQVSRRTVGNMLERFNVWARERLKEKASAERLG
jgi:RNA polymerase sigma-70 factor, ECF subfamily